MSVIRSLDKKKKKWIVTFMHNVMCKVSSVPSAIRVKNILEVRFNLTAGPLQPREVFAINVFVVMFMYNIGSFFHIHYKLQLTPDNSNPR